MNLLLPLSLLSSEAFAHVGDLINGIDVVPIDGSAPAVEASYGLLLPATEGWDWVCHEAVTSEGAVRAPRYARSPQGAWLAAVSDPTQGRGGRTLFRSDDACSWDDVDLQGVDDVVVTATAWIDADRAVAVTRDPGAVLLSEDGGRTFAPAVGPDAARSVTAAAVADDVVWATGLDGDGQRAWLWVDAAGSGFVEHEIAMPEGLEPPLSSVRLLATQGLTAFVNLVRAAGDVVVRTDDGGASFEVVYEADGAVVDAAFDAGVLWLALDGIELARVDETATTPLADFPRSIGLASEPGVLWAAPQSSLVAALLSRSSDGGETFETTAWPDDIGKPFECPDGSDVKTVCEPLWETLLPRIRGFDQPFIDTADTAGTADTATPAATDGQLPAEGPPPADKAGTCGCRAGSGVAWLGLLLVGVPGLIRRRRR